MFHVKHRTSVKY